jgi:hypothetical protein
MGWGTKVQNKNKNIGVRIIDFKNRGIKIVDIL